jgi:protein CpxP
MKKWIIGAAMLVIVSFQVDAQERKRVQPNPEERAKRMTEKMATELELSEEQKAHVLALNLDNAKKRQAEMDQAAAERKAKMTEMKAYQEKVKAILTEEQRTKWEEIKVEQRDKRRPQGEIQRRPERPRHHRGS